MPLIRLLTWFIACLLLATPAGAHLMPAQTATMKIIGKDAYLVVAAPASAFVGIDDDKNGALSLFEISHHSQSIATQFATRFLITEDGNPASAFPGWVSSPQTSGTPFDQAYVIILLHVQFAHPPHHPVVSTSLFGNGPADAQMTLSARQGDMAEVAILTPAAPTHTYFLGPLATCLDFIRVGVAHILTGPDHLLFLLTVIVASAGWRYWLSVVTSFTIAHSITLTLAALQIVKVSPAIVEPGIAASIVLIAVLNLSGGMGSTPHTQWRRVAVVFACGLLHGLGFASAIGAMAVDASHRLATLAGFNIGIEIGQFMFLGAMIGLAGLLRLIPTVNWPSKPGLRLPQVASLVAALLGTGMLIARILPQTG